MAFRKIVVGVDFSPASRAALLKAAQLAAESGAELTIAHVWEIPVFAVGDGAAFPAPVLEDVIAASQRLLETWQAEARALGARTVGTMLRNGAPWHELVELVRTDPSFDLIVVGTHGRTGIKHVLLGSVAERVVRHARCAVLVVRPDA